MKINPEYSLCVGLAKYLRLAYPKVLYRFDQAGFNLSAVQAMQAKEIQCKRGYPDLFIMEPRGGYHGMFIEVKAEGVKIFKAKSGAYSTPHIEEQAKFLDLLNDRGYHASFGVGFDSCKSLIDSYLNLKS